MSRRSSRLLSGGYYHSDEESDSSSVNISYRENPVKVFKKNRGGRKRRGGAEDSPSSSAGGAEDSPSSSAGGAEASLGASPSAWSPVSRPALRTPPSPPPPSPPVAPSLSRKPGLHSQTPSAVDSSGYSSSEDRCKRPSSSQTLSPKGPTGPTGPIRTTGPTGPRGPTRPTGPTGSRAAPRDWLKAAVSRLKDAVVPAVTLGALQSRLVQVQSVFTPPTSVTGASASSARMKRLLLLLLLLLLLIGVWWSSLLSLSIRTIISTEHSPDLQLSALDEASVSAAVEKKIQNIQKEMQLRQDRLLSELKQQLDVQALTHRAHQQEELWVESQVEAQVEARVEAQVEQRLAELQSTLQTLQTHSESTTTSLLLRISALEEQLAQTQQRVDPPPGPQLTPELEQSLSTWLSLRLQEQAAVQVGSCGTCDRPLADKMADFALESQGASVVSTRCSETYRTRSACVTLFGLPLWYPSESPRTVIQGPAVLLPGKCWAFHGVQGTLVIALSHPVHISHVTLDHLPRHSSPSGRIQSAPKDFHVYGLTNETETGTLLGSFRYQEDGEPSQTFSLSVLTEAVYRLVELRVLSNWGHAQYTCVYRFRVHGKMAATDDQ